MGDRRHQGAAEAEPEARQAPVGVRMGCNSPASVFNPSPDRWSPRATARPPATKNEGRRDWGFMLGEESGGQRGRGGGGRSGRKKLEEAEHGQRPPGLGRERGLWGPRPIPRVRRRTAVEPVPAGQPRWDEALESISIARAGRSPEILGEGETSAEAGDTPGMPAWTRGAPDTCPVGYRAAAQG